MYPCFLGLDIFSTFLGLLVISLLTILYIRHNYHDKMPPGPAWVPVVGNIKEFVSDPDLRIALRRLKNKYGAIYKVYVGPKPTIVVSGYDAIKELFIKRGTEVSDRPAADLLTLIVGDKRGIMTVSGDLWKKQKKFILRALRNIGIGKTKLEDKIHVEVKLFLSEIEKRSQKPFQMMAPIQISFGNVISHLVFGGHFSHDDPRFKIVMEGSNFLAQNISAVSPVIFMPILRFIPGDLFGVKTMTKHLQVVKKFVQELIAEHMKRFDEETVEDFIDAFILELKKENNGDMNNIFTMEYLPPIVLDLFLAGMQTTSTTFTWASFYLATRPDIQNRIFEEIKENVGTERLPSMQDKQRLVYTEAFIMEVLRISNIVIVSVPHAPVRDVSIQGYHIPKGMQIFPDISSVLSDPVIWGDPESFRPERFVSDEGTLLKPDEFIPFFSGKRNCLGESLARMELLLFISALVQRFELMPPEGEVLDIKNVDGIFGFTHAPKPFDIRAIPRQDEK